MDLKILFSQFNAKRLDSKIKYSRKMRNLQYTHKMFSVFIIPYLFNIFLNYCFLLQKDKFAGKNLEKC